jgi:hypothetical protein
MAAAASLLVAGACTGGAGSSDNNGGSGGGDPGTEMPKSEDSLKRNPQHPLKCDRPITENPLTSPLARLTDREYVNTLRDLLGGLVGEGDLPAPGDLPAEPAENLFTNNTSIQRLSDTRADLYENISHSLAEKAVLKLPQLMGCQPANQGEELGCVAKFSRDFGLRAWRRPLVDDELKAAEALFTDARKTFDFKTSVQAMVAGFIGAPQFLYRHEEGAGGETESKGRQLSDYEMASRLSYLLWDSMPDARLFDAAKKGDLSNPDDVESEARRMLDDPRARQAMATFYREWLHIERVESRLLPSKKDPGVYKDYGDAQYTGLMTSLDRFLEDAFWEGEHSMKRLYTSSRGFVNDDVAKIFGVDSPGGSDFKGVDLPGEERQGFLTQPGFMGGWAHATEQAPILRGAFIMEHVLCAPSPDPPDNADLTIKPVENREEMTYRQFVANTVETGSCKGCHIAIDGFGFLFENYDGIGAYQTMERHLKIDASNTVRGTFDLDGDYKNGVEFTQALAKSEQAAQCAVEKLYEYAMTRQTVTEDGCAIAPLTDAFIDGGFDFHSLIAKLARSSAFRFRTTAQ